ncbi:hypothetical protein DFJ67_3495 [Asanoa ferruginea]|uniref:Uncharacterized protein n=1 Tax=Asanoa ferruginea TaxID=53367 RepID=A0A3D9ZJP7_9ACTN|nr:hypothetical protein [Asanoa ferruginea]REF97495.1 hypothetical protein DFJ67_3495 [Asanoa ferruginea]GIF48218.1 hypothetical protein Afe04nite_27570 [Asanoa ferruginea]
MTRFTILERSDADLQVVAEFSDAETDTYPVGPQRLMIELACHDPAGIGTEILRRADRRLSDMVGEFNEILAVGGHHRMVVQYVEARLATLPADGDAFHRGLLDLHDDLALREQADPALLLSAAMRMPEETARACLQVARQRLGREAA